jgi:hypothetical protein
MLRVSPKRISDGPISWSHQLINHSPSRDEHRDGSFPPLFFGAFPNRKAMDFHSFLYVYWRLIPIHIPHFCWLNMIKPCYFPLFPIMKSPENPNLKPHTHWCRTWMHLSRWRPTHFAHSLGPTRSASGARPAQFGIRVGRGFSFCQPFFPRKHGDFMEFYADL